MPTPPRPSRRVLLGLVGLVVWAAIAVPTAVVTFLDSSRPDRRRGPRGGVAHRRRLGGGRPGPVPAELRYPAGGRLGARIELGKTLGHVLRRARAALRLHRGSARGPDREGRATPIRDSPSRRPSSARCAGLVAPAVWSLLGPRRRRELVGRARRTALTVAVGGSCSGRRGRLVAVAALGTPPGPGRPVSDRPACRAGCPTEARAAARWTRGLLTQGTKRLVESALDSYRRARSSTSRPPRRWPPRRRGARGRGRRDRGGARLRPARQHPHGPGGAGGRRPGAARPCCSTRATTPRPDRRGRRSASSPWTRRSTTSRTASSSPATTTTATSSPSRPTELGFTALDGEVVEGPRRHPAARRRRPSLQRAGQLAGRDGAVVRRGRANGSPTRRAPRTRTASGSARCWCTTPNLGREALERGCVDLVSPATCTRWSGPSAVSGENGEVGYRSRPARPAARRTPSRSAPSRAATPRSRWSPTATGGRSGCSG